MHTIFITRGIQQQVDLWKTFMQSQMFLFPQIPLLKDDKGNFIKNEDGTYKHTPLLYSEDIFEYDKDKKPILKDGKPIIIHRRGDIVYDKNGKQVDLTILKASQGALRPIQIWEYVYPKESHADVLAMLGAIDADSACNPHQRPLAWVLRKAMGLKPVEFPEQFKGKKITEIPCRYIPREAVAISVVGTKDDITKDFIFGNEAYYQEGL